MAIKAELPGTIDTHIISVHLLGTAARRQLRGVWACSGRCQGGSCVLSCFWPQELFRSTYRMLDMMHYFWQYDN